MPFLRPMALLDADLVVCLSIERVLFTASSALLLRPVAIHNVTLFHSTNIGIHHLPPNPGGGKPLPPGGG